MTHLADTVTTPDPSLARRRCIIAVTAALALVASIGIVTATLATRDGSAATESSTTAPVVTDPESGAADGIQDPVQREAEASTTEATATRVQIPAIDVDSSLEQLPLDPDTGELTPPVEWLSAGWYRDGTVPGDVGPAVIAGHVDSVTAPAVFARLGELVPGDEIIVTLSTGDTHTFSVDSQTDAPKNDFPTDLVYGPTPTPQLRLITCDGDFDGATGHYLDNLIVFASLDA